MSQAINIFADRVFAGNGTIDKHGAVDCGAILGGSQDACESIYDAIEVAIAEGEGSVEVSGVTYTWDITDAD